MKNTNLLSSNYSLDGTISVSIKSNEVLANISGELDKNFKLLEEKVGSKIYFRGNSIIIKGDPAKNKKIEQAINFLVERTSSGMKIVDASRIGKVVYSDQVPIKKNNMFSKASMGHKSHFGHDHAFLPYEWTFSIDTQGKILQGMFRNEEKVLVGLNAFEQSILSAYEIKNGNTFQTTIKGHKFLIEKTSAGIKVINHADVQNLAMATQYTEKM